MIKWKTSKKRTKTIQEISQFYTEEMKNFQGRNENSKEFLTKIEFILEKALAFLKTKHRIYKFNLLYSIFYTIYVTKKLIFLKLDGRCYEISVLQKFRI